MDAISNPGLLIAGVLVILIGLFFRRYASRYDFASMAMSSAWHLARGKRTAEAPTEIEERLTEIRSAKSAFGKAGRVGGNVIGHFLAPVMGLIGLILYVAGVILIGLGFYG